MDVVRAFQSDVNYLTYFNNVERIHAEHDSYFKGLVAELEATFQSLLNVPTQSDDFLVPEVPKVKKGLKEKRESRATKKTLSISVKCMNPSDTLTSQNEDEDVFRRSSRIAAKIKVTQHSVQLPPPCVEKSPDRNADNNITYVTSPCFPPAKIRRTGDADPESIKSSILKRTLDESVCTTDMKMPLGSSTPTDILPDDEHSTDIPDATQKTLIPSAYAEPKTPVSDLNRPIKGESVKKRVEEFEKRTQAAVTSASKLPVRTPDKKKLFSTSSKADKYSKTNDATDCKLKTIYIEKETVTAAKGRCTRNNSKVLQEKSANIKTLKEKGHDAQKKKEVIMKASIEETKRKREERTRKAAAQREAVEKEKLESALKLEKEKEEKIRTIQKQKEEKFKMECLKKKQLAAAKAAEAEERRRKEEAAKLIKAKETDSKAGTYDYAIDHVLDGASSDDEEQPKNQIPSWATKENRKYPLMVQAWLNKKETVYPWFYNETSKYPKLKELFSEDVKTRPRTSSAFWNTKVNFDESFPIM